MFHVKHQYCLRSAFLFKITCQNSDIPRTPSTSCLGFVFFHEKFMISSPSNSLSAQHHEPIINLSTRKIYTSSITHF